MKDITHIGWIKAKAILFLLTGALAVGLLLIECPRLTTAALLAVGRVEFLPVLLLRVLLDWAVR